MNIGKVLRDICGEENVFLNEPMKNHTTFKVGGPAKFFVVPENEEQIQRVVEVLRGGNVKYFVVGNGSNLIVSDEGFDGVVISVYRKHSNVYIKGNEITAEAGAMLSSVGRIAIKHQLSGFEFATGIPGCVGGAVAMNAGAYGGEIKDCIVSCKVLDNEGNIITLSKDELELGYRHSIILEKGYIVLEAKFKLEEGDGETIEAKVRELAIARKSKQPLEFPSAGSTFKRPEGHFAGKLIEDCGLKGYRVGDMQISEKHAGFVINVGNGTAKEFIELTDYVAKKVFEDTGVKLELEVKVLK